MNSWPRRARTPAAGASNFVLLLDTQVLLWLSAEPERIGTEVHRRIKTGLAAAENSVSSISFWEIAMLIGKGRYRLVKPVLDWREDLLARGIAEIPVDGAIAAQAGGLDWEHGDPADRIVVATAMRLGATLLTTDRRILSWRGPVVCADARV
jgi:PIN domain nuclease of toxin-antitoxin system